jgi:vacuolar-type H+-ATPase subunit E/Vma4
MHLAAPAAGLAAAILDEFLELLERVLYAAAEHAERIKENGAEEIAEQKWMG